jgi:hypothetical protein
LALPEVGNDQLVDLAQQLVRVAQRR